MALGPAGSVVFGSLFKLQFLGPQGRRSSGVGPSDQCWDACPKRRNLPWRRDRFSRGKGGTGCCGISSCSASCCSATAHFRWPPEGEIGTGLTAPCRTFPLCPSHRLSSHRTRALSARAAALLCQTGLRCGTLRSPSEEEI